MADKVAPIGTGHTTRRCFRGSDSGEYRATERSEVGPAPVNCAQQCAAFLSSDTTWAHEDGCYSNRKDVASLLGVIAALTRELESRNEYIESNIRKMAALSGSLERALRVEFLWARTCVLEWAVSIGAILFIACLFGTAFC